MSEEKYLQSLETRLKEIETKIDLLEEMLKEIIDLISVSSNEMLKRNERLFNFLFVRRDTGVKVDRR